MVFRNDGLGVPSCITSFPASLWVCGSDDCLERSCNFSGSTSGFSGLGYAYPSEILGDRLNGLFIPCIVFTVAFISHYFLGPT